MRFVLAAFIMSAALLVTGPPAAGATFAYLDSEHGDYVGLGAIRTLIPADGFFSTTGQAGQSIWIQFDGGLTFWSFRFSVGYLVPLSPGHYEVRSPPLLDEPSMSISGEGRGCGSQYGSFDVIDVAYGPDGKVTRLAVDFEQYCGGWLRGILRFNSDDVPAFLDLDSDGHIDKADNCPDEPNPLQENLDLDIFGDPCDPFPSRADNLDACTEELLPLRVCRDELAACRASVAEGLGNLDEASRGLAEIARLLALPLGHRASAFVCAGSFCPSLQAIVDDLLCPPGGHTCRNPRGQVGGGR